MVTYLFSMDTSRLYIVTCSLYFVTWYKRVSNCICFYCICCGARGVLRRVFHPFRRVTAHVSRHSAHDGEGERKRGLVTVVHRVNYTIFAALRVGFRGRFPWPRKVSVVRREQIRVLIKTAAAFQPFNFSTSQLLNRLRPTFQLFNFSTFQLFKCRGNCRGVESGLYLKTAASSAAQRPQWAQSSARGQLRTWRQRSPAWSKARLSNDFGNACAGSISSARLPS